MAKKDKFKQMQQGGGALSSFQALADQAATVAAIEQQATTQQTPITSDVSSPADNPKEGKAKLTVTSVATRQSDGEWQPVQQPKFMRLPNPQIPLKEYNLVSLYCSSLPNMTRQDFVELAIVEKLHALGQLTDDGFTARQTEIRNRPPRGQRKGTKQTRK